MSEEKDLVDRLDALVKELPTSFASVVLEVSSEIRRLRKVVQDQDTAFRAEVKQHDSSKKEVDLLTDENEGLRVRLHSTELQLARVEGYRDRVNEFDQVTEQQAYADQLPQLRSARERGHQQYEGVVSYAGGERVAPWFARMRERRA